MAPAPTMASSGPKEAAAPSAITWDDGDPAPPPSHPEIVILSSTLRETLAEIRFPSPVLTPVTHRGRQVVAVDMPGNRPLKEANQPALPVDRWDVILPVNAQASLEIVSIDDETVPSVPPIPSAGFGRRPDPLPAGDFGKAYASGQPFPAQVARLTPTYQIRQLRGTGIVIHPVRYLPAAEALQVIRSVRLRVRYTPTMPGGTISHPPRPRSSAFRALANSRFENYEAMVTTTAATRADGSLHNSDKLLIVVPDAWEGVQDDFVRWKRQRGLSVSVAGYPSDTGEGVPALTSYLQTAYDSNQITYVLLIGDEDAIPHGEGDQKGGTPSDTVYTLVAGADHYHDLLISRISTPASPRAATLLAKAVAYERDPNTTDGWHARATMVASSQVSTTSAASPYYGKTDYEHLGALRTLLLASDLFDSVAEAYQGSASGTSAKVSSAWNAGHGLLYYLGHGSATTWTSVPYGTTDVEALTNGTALPFVINGACVNGAFQYSPPCLAEAMLWGNTTNGADGSGGAIAVIASTTNMDWDPPIAMLDAFTGYYLGESAFTVGDQDLADQPVLWDASSLAFASIQRAMDYCASANGDGLNALELIMQQTHLFGDCTLGVRTVTPRALVAAHVDTVSPGTGLEVTVNAPERGPVAAATVTLTDAAGNMSTAVTDGTGRATVPATAFVPGDTVTLTVYERNSLPYQKTGLPVGDGTVVILAAQPPTGFQAEPFSHTFAAVAGTPPYSWSVSAGALPPGMSLNGTTGEFSGSPTTGGDFAFTVQVTDASADPDQDQMAVVWTVGQAVQISDQDLAEATVGTPYSAAASATGSFPPFTFSMTGGSLPPGLSLATDGTMAGTPTRQGSHTFALRVTDEKGRTDEAAVGITVAAGAAVTILTTDLADATIGIAYSAQLEGAGGSGGGYVWELTSGTLPAGLTLSASGTIQGTATTHGTATFTVRLADDTLPPRTATQEFSLVVGQPVTITTTAFPPAMAGLSYSTQITAVGNYVPFAFTTIGGTTYTQQTTAATFVEGGTLQADWRGDETHHALDLGFAFPYFGQTYTSCEVGDNGYLVFGGDGPTTGLSGDCWNATAAQFATFRMIAPFWSDLLILEGAADTGIWLTQTANSVTIRWRGLDYHYVAGGDDPPDLVNMAVTIHASGRIAFSYGSIQTANRVIVGLSNGGEPASTILYDHGWDQYAPDYVTGWSEAADRVFVPQGLVPPGLSLSAAGLLSGTPTEARTYELTVHVADASGNVDQATLALEVRENQVDTNGDGDIDSDEILAYIERWQDGEVSEADVEAAVHHWQLGPPASRQESRSVAAAPSPRSSLIVTFGDRATLDRLADHGLTITSVHGNQAYIHATAKERAWLRALGLPTVEEAPSVSRAAPATYAALATELQTMADTHPTLCRIEQIGTSVNGKELLALVISDFPHTDEDEPEVRIVGGIHGDERLGATLSFRLADWLLTNYGGTDADGVRATALVDGTELWVLPMLNPDGWEANTRENGNGQDLNRSFPDGIVGTVSTVFAEGAPDTSGMEPETAAFMAWTAARRFTLGATLHTGAKLVCYPYGNRQDGASLYSATPDDALFIDLSHAYVDNHPDMATDGTVTGGIINSCDWYRVLGELPDWAYRYTGSLEVTVELDTPDAPPEDPAWADNQESMLAFIQYAQRGIRGIVRDAVTGTPLSAAIGITGNSREVYTDPDAGDYHRVLLPGTYSVTVSAPGYLPQTAVGVVVAGEAATRLDLDLTPDTGQHRLCRSFPTVLYTADAANTVSLEVDVDEAASPSAFIVAETLPDGWVYQANSAVDTGSGDALASPRIDGHTVSWLFWRTDVHDQQFDYTALAPRIRNDTAVFGGVLVTATGSAAASGDTTWLAQTESRFALELATGWNLISLPLEPDDSRPASLFGESSGIAVWDWDCAALRYRVPSQLKAKDGYWVYAPAPASFIIEGDAPPDNERDFTQGWNLFGPLDDRPLLDETFFRGNTIEWSEDSYRAASSLLRCRGYWIRAALPGPAALR